MGYILAIIAGALIALALLLALAGIVWQGLGSAKDARKFPPPGRRFSVGGHRLHFHATGKGIPPVIFDSGLPGSTLSWNSVQPAIAKITQTCSYDRAGLGWSEPGPLPRTTERIVEELHSLLAIAGIPPPYIFVGHSFGGLTARFYASRYPEEIARMVLVDPLDPGEWNPLTPEQKKTLAAAARMARRTGWYARFGLLRLYFFLVGRKIIQPRVRSDWVDSLKKLPPDLLPPIRALWSRPEPFEALAAQIESLGESTAQVAALPAPRGFPLILLSAGNVSEARGNGHVSLAQESAQAKHVIVSDSGHWIHLEQPEIVIRAIEEVIEMRKSGSDSRFAQTR